MKEFVFGTAAQFTGWKHCWPMAAAMCLSTACCPRLHRRAMARLGLKRTAASISSTSTTASRPRCRMQVLAALEQGEVRFVCMQDMVEFLVAQRCSPCLVKGPFHGVSLTERSKNTQVLSH